jgi:hypothetical protein
LAQGRDVQLLLFQAGGQGRANRREEEHGKLTTHRPTFWNLMWTHQARCGPTLACAGHRSLSRKTRKQTLAEKIFVVFVGVPNFGVFYKKQPCLLF